MRMGTRRGGYNPALDLSPAPPVEFRVTVWVRVRVRVRVRALVRVEFEIGIGFSTRLQDEPVVPSHPQELHQRVSAQDLVVLGESVDHPQHY